MIERKKRVLVTGGAGLIGSYLLPKLIAKGYEVLVLDDLSRGQRKNIPEGCRLIEGDAASILDHDIGQVDVLYHLASFMFGLGYSEKNQTQLYHRNTLISDGVLNFLKTQSKNCKVVYISSSCVYSDDGPDCVNESTFLGDLPEQANIGYGFSKRHMEDRLRLASRVDGFSLSIVRPFNVYGERYRWVGEYSQAIPMLIHKVMTSHSIEVWGSGNQRRTYVHAEDCAEILCRVGEATQAIPLLNIGHEKTISLNEMTKKIAFLANKNIEIVNNTQKPEGRFVKACQTNILKEFFPDFEFSVSLDEGLCLMLNWWRDL